MEKEALLAIYEAASDYILGLKLPQFSDEYGGIKRLLQELERSVREYEIKFNMMDEDE